MEPQSGPYSAQPQPSDIDPRLQEASRPYTNAPDPEAGRPPTIPPSQHHQQQQQQQQQPHPPQTQQFAPPPQWQQDGYNPFYASSGHQAPLTTHMPHHQNFHAYQENSLEPAQQGDGDSKRPRACEACRGLKVRCEPDPGNGPCKRCAKANRHCVITPPSRKRQKKTDSRVAELERKIDGLTAVLQATKAGNLSVSDDGIYGTGDKSHISGTDSTPQHQTSPYSVFDGTNRKRPVSRYQQDDYGGILTGIAAAASGQHAPNIAPNMVPTRPAQVAKMQDLEPPRFGPPTSYESADVIHRGILRMEIAKDLFDHYNQNMVPQMPLVPFPSDTTAETIRNTKPILFLAIMSVASGQDYPQIQATLKQEIKRVLADKVIVSGEKSVELVQALQVITIWYWPEANGDSQYFQLAHLSAVMAMDLSIDRKPRMALRKSQLIEIPGLKATPLDTEAIECRRAWLGCYLLSSSISMGKRRPSIVRPNAYLEECIAKVHESDGTADFNHTLVYWVKLQVLADELSAQLLQNDVANYSVSQAKARAAYMSFEKQLKDWEEAKNVVLHPSFVSNVIKLYMHELLMQQETGPEPPKASRGRSKNHSQVSPYGPADPFNIGFTSIQGILDTFLGFTIHQIRTLPSFQFAQIAHASVSLMKMFFVAKSDAEFRKTAPVSQEIVEIYNQRICEQLRTTAADGKSLAAHTFLMVFDMMSTMFEKHKDSDLQAIRAKYGGVPSTKGTQILDLEEPSPIPQRKTTLGLQQNAKGGLQLLSEVAMEDSNANGYKDEEGQPGNSGQQYPSVEGGELTGMGQFMGDGEMGSLSDDGFFGIMQKMWARSAT
ncbi:hypothetical protein P7C71_g3160, partial [Lecanoromycetidae sp. Uapishka_2]